MRKVKIPNNEKKKIKTKQNLIRCKEKRNKLK